MPRWRSLTVPRKKRNEEYVPADLERFQNEAWHQRRLIQECDLHPQLKRAFHIPNGGARSLAVGAELKRQGVRRGMPDIFVPIQTDRFNGLFLELKRFGGKASPEQIEALTYFQGQGYACAISYGWRDAYDTMLLYLDDRYDTNAWKSHK